jgi:hypothetical protein
VVAAIAAAAFAVARRNCRRFKFVVSFMVREGRAGQRVMPFSANQFRGDVLAGNDTKASKSAQGTPGYTGQGEGRAKRKRSPFPKPLRRRAA